MSPQPLRGGHFRRLNAASADREQAQDHPIDRLVASLPEVQAVDRRARRLAGRLGIDPTVRLDPATWIRYEDLRLFQRALRQEAYFDAGWELGAVAGAAASLRASGGDMSTAAELAAADDLGLAVVQLAFTAPVNRDRAAATLLEIARGLLLGMIDAA